MNTLYIIPARGGSKGIPGKNIKLLGGKPLINYSIELARKFAPDEDICVSTDDTEILRIVKETGLHVPFTRPASLATDQAGTYDVLLHALDYYEQAGRQYDRIMLLQPTSPFRLEKHVTEISSLYNEADDMVVSVAESHQNPYFSLFEENQAGYLEKSKPGYYERRQDCPPAYYYNGSLYLINTRSLRRNKLHKFERIKKYVMEDIYSKDIDTPLDWLICEAILNAGYYK